LRVPRPFFSGFFKEVRYFVRLAGEGAPQDPLPIVLRLQISLSKGLRDWNEDGGIRKTRNLEAIQNCEIKKVKSDFLISSIDQA
jgi:hypothetical protein